MENEVVQPLGGNGLRLTGELQVLGTLLDLLRAPWRASMNGA